MARGTHWLHEEGTIWRVVEEDMKGIGDEKFDPAERIGGTRLLAQSIGKMSYAKL
jgi:hypothetical protein